MIKSNNLGLGVPTTKLLQKKGGNLHIWKFQK